MAIPLFFKRAREINKVVLIPLAQVVRNPYQPRKVFRREDIRELADSIKINGLLQPIVVRRIGEQSFELVAGERRSMAFRELEEELIPAIVEDYTDTQSAVLALIENLQRKDLNYFEEAYGISRLMEQTNVTQQDIAVRLGKAQSTVANKLRLLKFPIAVQKRLMESDLSERHARALLKLEGADEATLLGVIDEIIGRQMNVSQTEEYVELLQAPPAEEKQRTRLFVVKDMRIFLNTMKKAVTMMNTAGIPVETDKNETEDYFEYTIRVPKESMYAKPREKAHV